ncbi:hypothetical protein PspTeo4_18672 [Pseudomonas sp. Teo4]|nr:hypothetical protein [Pseudomonas sp. Teo4]
MLLALSIDSHPRYASYSLYLITDIGLSNWLSRTPAIKSAQSLTIGNVGMVLLSFFQRALC